jgi:NADPH:quinone reductase-like Zn-dependent oxidoreductase
MTNIPEFKAFRIHADRDNHRAGIEQMRTDDLSPGEVLIKTAYSSVGCAGGTGKGRILRESPLNGGIDVAGYVVASTDANIKEGDQVLCTGCGLRNA